MVVGVDGGGGTGGGVVGDVLWGGVIGGVVVLDGVVGVSTGRVPVDAVGFVDVEVAGMKCIL